MNNRVFLTCMGWVLATCLGVAGAWHGAALQESSERLWHLRNLGKALYENPTTQDQAVDVLEQALALAPDSPRERINYALALLRAGRVEEARERLRGVQNDAPEYPHTWFNLGILLKKEARYEAARGQFEKMVTLVPQEPVSRYNLGVLLKLDGQIEAALEQFRTASELAPNLAGPHFQIYSTVRALGDDAAAQEAFQEFRRLKDLQAETSLTEDLEWSYYSELVEEPPHDFGNRLPQNLPTVQWQESGTGVELSASSRGVQLLPDEHGALQALFWSTSEVAVIGSDGKRVDPTGLEGLDSIVSLSPGDWNNDGLMDLCVVGSEQVSVWTRQDGRFVEHSRWDRAGVLVSLWLDFDHDSDLDLFLLGQEQVLLRNQGDAGFLEQTASFPFRDAAIVAATVIDSVKDYDGLDLVVVEEDGRLVLYKDRLAGIFEAEPGESVGFPSALHAVDLNHDGWTDLLMSDLAETGSPWGVLWNEQGSLGASRTGPGEGEVDAEMAVGDLLNQGRASFSAGAELRIMARSDRTPGTSAQGSHPHPVPEARIPPLEGPRKLVDLNTDGKLDLVGFSRTGEISFWRNESEDLGNWLEVELEGVRSLKLAQGAEVEVKAGALYQKQLYQGLPLHFGLGDRETVDAVRITWPNGLIQNEIELAAGQKYHFREKQRLSGSCPMVFTWNGSEFQFISDVLAVAPLGAAAGDGVFFNPDRNEYLRLPADALATRDGKYEIRITEELREVGYIDQVQLVAVDYPKELLLVSDEKFKAPPFPEFRLFGVQERFDALEAYDHRGRDVRSFLARADGRYPTGFRRAMDGSAETHWLEMEFDAAAREAGADLLVLSGWVDWVDGSTIRRLAQTESHQVQMPFLQVPDSKGGWMTVVSDMGVPAGKPKTIAVDLRGSLPAGETRIRIVTNLSVYWDEIYLATRREGFEPRTSRLSPHRTDLRFRGFSKSIIHPLRLEPESFDYTSWQPNANWNQTPGLYTRYGEVEGLLEEKDDRLVVMGSGDELRLSFEAAALPPVAEGLQRSFYLFVEGWAKDGDLNTAYSQSVDPLPFHGMKGYPYPVEDYPAQLESYREKFNTREALKLLPSLSGTRGREVLESRRPVGE